MSSSDFKNMYIVVIILTLLFGVGLGYQIHTLVATKDSETANTNGALTNTLPDGRPNAQAITTIYSRTGMVTKVENNKIVFQAYVLGTNSYNLTTLTATITDATQLTKLTGSSSTATKIGVTDIKAGNEISVVSAENMYGKTSFSASSIQLHQL